MVLFHVNVGSTCLTVSSCERGVWSRFPVLQSCKVCMKYDDKKRRVLLMQGLCLRCRKDAGRHNQTLGNSDTRWNDTTCSIMFSPSTLRRLMEYIINLGLNPFSESNFFGMHGASCCRIARKAEIESPFKDGVQQGHA